MNLHVINTGYFKLDGGAMFGVVPKTIWQKLNPPDENNLCTWAMRCLLIEDEGKLILVDTGLGNKQSEKFFSYYQPHGVHSLQKSINQLGIDYSDITDVILTHLHFDHCGGAVSLNDRQTLIPTFKNATYWSHSKHWEWAEFPNAREKASFLKENFLPIRDSGQLKFTDDEKFCTEKISFHVMNGHTEAMLLPEINYNGQALIYAADLFPSPHHIPVPYIMAYDTRPLVTLHEKEIFLNEIVAQRKLLFFEHDKSMECCSVEKSERGYKMKEPLKLGDII